MTDQVMTKRTEGFSRRAFLNTGVAAGALAVFGPSVLAPGAAQAAANGEVMTGSHWGIMHATVEDGRWVAVRGWDDGVYESPVLPGVMDSVYSPTRIKYPMVRRAFLEGGPGTATETRGRDDFVRVTWDEAFDLVASELRRVEDEYGPTGTFAGSYGWKSPGKLHNCQVLMRRMLNLKGGYVNSSGDYSTAAAQVIMPHVMGTIEVYEQQTAWPVVVEDTDLLVFWGANPMVTNQIDWLVAEHGSMKGLEDFKATGKTVICIDPERSETCTHMNAEWIAPRPQTDVAMMLGIAHTLHEEGLADEDFLANYTVGFDRFLPYLTGESDGQPKDADWAAAICDVPADTLRDLARRFAGNRTMLAGGWSIQRQHMGEQRHWMMVTLAAMLGQIGLPGGGFGLSYHYSNGGSPTATGPVLSGITDGGREVEGAAWLTASGAATIPVARVVDMLENPGGTFDFNGDSNTFPDVKMVYWVGGNPFAHHQDRNRMVNAWRRLETVVVQDFQWTATARQADIVLPATTSYERNDLEQTGSYALSNIVAMKKVVEPMYEARSDYDIFAGIAERLGKRAEFDDGKDEMTWLREFYDGAKAQADASGYEMAEFDEFWEAGIAKFPVDDGASYVRYADFRADPLFEPLGTPTGLIEIYSTNIERMGYDDCPPHPTWMEPIERLGQEGVKYPLHVSAAHSRWRLHSQTCGTKLRAEYAISGREPCIINTADAAERGIADGDLVRVFNDRGHMLVGAVVTDDIRPGVIRVSEGGWYSPVEPGEVGTLDAYGDVNMLTPDIGTSKLAQGNCGHTMNAEVEKFDGEPPAVTVFDTPANA